MKPEIIIAVKEFKSSLASKRFLLIFALLMVMSIAAIVTGVGDYRNQIASYNANLTQAASSISGRKLPMPSMMLVFQRFSVIFATVGWLLAIAIGFDLISKEKDAGSLKLLLARPLFRDSIINGKIIGSMAIIIMALAVTFMLSIALLMLLGITPTGDDLASIIIFFVVLSLFSLAFLSIAIMASVIAKNSTMAMLIAIGLVVFSLFIPNFSSSVSGIILGPAPPETIPYSDSAMLQLNAGSGGPHAVHIGNSSVGDVATINGIMMMDNPAYRDYEINEWAITGTLDLLSPISDFNSISSAVVQPETVDYGPNGNVIGINQNGLTVIPELISLLLITITGFAIAYTKFLRLDVP